MVAMVGRPLQVTESRVPVLERRLLTAAWAMKRLQRYTWWTQITIRLPEPAEATVAQANELPLRIQAVLVELSQYGCLYAWGEGAWALQGDLARLPMASEGEATSSAGD